MNRVIIRNGILVSGSSAMEADIRIDGGRIGRIDRQLAKRPVEVEIDARGYYVFPGLINSHDHLEFNLYPRLGAPPYANAYEWGRDVHARSADVIRSVESVPVRLRLWWGAWKNLFSGVTFVIHHGIVPFFYRRGLPVGTLRLYSIAHSLKFDEDIERSIKKRKPGRPFIIHVAEGTDNVAAGEIRELYGLGGLDRDTVAVHSVAAANGDAELLATSGASVVWCPSSNLFLFGATAPIHEYLPRTRVALGTDSSLTGVPTLFEELRLAHEWSGLPSDALFRMVTTTPREIFGLPAGTGELIEGGPADLFLLAQKHTEPIEQLLSCEPRDVALLLRRGRPVLWDSDFRERIPGNDSPSVRIQGRAKFIADRRFPERFRAIRHRMQHYWYFSDVDS
ncbi:MAG: amidohydrolase family protein [Ignavibacteriales bacterium]|nr:amidohydrolase family protein [Ignavibacteriales bacterium]